MSMKPSREESELQPAATRSEAIVRDITGETHTAPGAGESEVETYTVKPGDTLEHIARRFYGDPDEANRILDANRDRLDRNGELSAGQKLRIPVRGEPR